jgi:Na+-driven multidrug efflux pump
MSNSLTLVPLALTVVALILILRFLRGAGYQPLVRRLLGIAAVSLGAGAIGFSIRAVLRGASWRRCCCRQP